MKGFLIDLMNFICLAVGKVLNDYASETSIHGFRYLVEGKRINGYELD